MIGEPHKQAEIASRTPEFMAAEASKPFGWEAYHWVRWATVVEIFMRLEVVPGAHVVDIGCGPGWTSLFLAESGYDVTAIDLVPANIELTLERAARWQVPMTALVGDMEHLELGHERFDLALIYDALHHTKEHQRVLERVRVHLQPGGWLVLGEPSWLIAANVAAAPKAAIWLAARAPDS